MRGSPHCSLEYSTLRMHCNKLQVTTSNNEILIFRLDTMKPAMIKRIDNSQDFCIPQKYVDPSFTATALVEKVVTFDENEKDITIQAWLSLIQNSQGSIIMRIQEIFNGKEFGT